MTSQAKLRILGLVLTAVFCGVGSIVPEPWSQVLILCGGGISGWLGLKQPGQR